MRTLELTGRDLVRALGAAIVARPAVDAAVQARAEEIAADVTEAGGAARVVRRGHADYAVEGELVLSESHPASSAPLTNSA